MPANTERDAGFRVTSGTGFHITFENGWTVSVQFGQFNYCAARHMDTDVALYQESSKTQVETAEIAAWDRANNWHDFGEDTVAGWKSPAEVLAFMAEIASLPDAGPVAASAPEALPTELQTAKAEKRDGDARGLLRDMDEGRGEGVEEL